MTEALGLYKLLGGWRSLLGIAGTLVLGILLVIQKGETRHWHKQSDRYDTLYQQTQAAFTTTVANYRAAAAKAAAADRANADRVLAQQASINQERDKSYEARIADARSRADSLQRQLAAAPANPSGSGPAPVSVPNAPAGGATQAPSQAGLPPGDALVATEQAIQLDELIKWVKSTVGIDRTGTDSSSAPQTGSH